MKRYLLLVVVMLLMCSACSNDGPTGEEPIEQPQSEPDNQPPIYPPEIDIDTASGEDELAAPPEHVDLSQTYTNEEEGFTFNYPDSWGIPMGFKAEDRFQPYFYFSNSDFVIETPIVSLSSNLNDPEHEGSISMHIYRGYTDRIVADRFFTFSYYLYHIFPGIRTISDLSDTTIDGTPALKMVIDLWRDDSIVGIRYLYVIGLNIYRIDFFASRQNIRSLEWVSDAIMKSFKITRADDSGTTPMTAAEEARAIAQAWLDEYPYAIHIAIFNHAYRHVKIDSDEFFMFSTYAGDSKLNVLVNKETGGMLFMVRNSRVNPMTRIRRVCDPGVIWHYEPDNDEISYIDGKIEWVQENSLRSDDLWKHIETEIRNVMNTAFSFAAIEVTIYDSDGTLISSRNFYPSQHYELALIGFLTDVKREPLTFESGYTFASMGNHTEWPSVGFEQYGYAGILYFHEPVTITAHYRHYADGSIEFHTIEIDGRDYGIYTEFEIIITE